MRQLTAWAMLGLVAGCGDGQPGTTENGDPASRPGIETSAVEPAASATPYRRMPAPEGARVYIVEPQDGAVVRSPFTVRFGADGVNIVKAGIMAHDSGHHHLIVDADLPEMNLPIPANDNYLHFGDGSTSTVLSLAPGEHRLRLLLGDHLHLPHDPPVYSAPVRITVSP